MKIHSECVPCLIKRIIFESEECTNDKRLQVKATRNACRVLAELYDPNDCSATIATKVHRVVYKTLGNDDPYAELKRRSNMVAQSLVPRVKELIKNSDDPLKSSMICSIIGNMMDFGIEGGSAHPDVLQEIFENSYQQGLGYDDYPTLKKLLAKAKLVVFFSDNCGEIVFDKLLCRELKKMYPQMMLTLVVKGEKILSDATRDDAQELKFEEIVDNIFTTGGFAVGVDFSLISSELKHIISHCDLIICKGMANYESFSETNYAPIAYLLRTKCKAIADSMNIPLHVNAIKVFQ
jgi:uncharacterized protein with ATP-grasp and redox domains